MLVTSDNPLRTEQVFALTGKDAICRIGDYNCRIMNFSPNQKIEVVDVVEWKDKLWGIKEITEKKEQYQYFAFLVKREN